MNCMRIVTGYKKAVGNSAVIIFKAHSEGFANAVEGIGKECGSCALLCLASDLLVVKKAINRH